MDSQAGDSAMAGHQLKLSKVKSLAYRFNFRQIRVRYFCSNNKKLCTLVLFGHTVKLTVSKLTFLRLTSPTNALGPAHLGKHI